MEFRYPKARLFAYNQLSGGRSCFSVLIDAVVGAGLLSEESAGKLMEESEHSGSCGSLYAAEKIVKAFMAERHDEEQAATHSQLALSQIKSDVELWKQSAQSSHGVDCDAAKDASCRDMAPVVLDLLLQQITRHT